MNEQWKRLIKFGITGVANTLVDFIVFTILSQFLLINVYVAQVFGYSAGILNSYIINRSWTFQTKNKFFSSEFLRFIFVNLVMLGISVLLLYLFNDILEMKQLLIFGKQWGSLLAKLIATGIVMLLGFFVNRKFVFQNT